LDTTTKAVLLSSQFRKHKPFQQPSIKMKTNLVQSAAALGILATFCGTAQADLSFSTSGTVSSYVGSPVYTSTAAASATVAQGQPSLASGASFYALSETFTPSSSYTLNQIDILGGVNTANTSLSIHLYDVTGVALQSTSAFYFPGTDLFGGGAGLSFTVAPIGAAQWIFSLSNGSTSDQIALTAGRTYAVEIWTPAAIPQNNVQWYRAGQVATDGQMMGSHDASSSVSRNAIAALGLAGGVRTGSLALYAAPVPEPASLALLGVGGLAGILLRRRNQ
jgi:hypothetical protein